MSFSAAVLRTLGAPLSVENLELPDALDVGQVLVDVRVAGICGAQVNEASGAKGADPYLPHLLGHEGAGIVRGVGPGVRHVRPGDHVVCHWRKGPGIDAAPPKYRSESGETIGAGPVATFAERAIVSENRLTRIPPDVPFEMAALLGCGVTTGVGIVANEARVRLGESVVVAGVGGVGLAVAHSAALAGAYPVVAVDPSGPRRNLALHLGATVARADISAWTEPVDVAVECTGLPGVIARCLDLLKPGGRLVLVGQPEAGAALTFGDARRHYCGKTILDSQGGLTEPARDIPRCIALWRARKLRLGEMAGGRWPLERVNEAMAAMAMGDPGRALLVMA